MDNGTLQSPLTSTFSITKLYRYNHRPSKSMSTLISSLSRRMSRRCFHCPRVIYRNTLTAPRQFNIHDAHRNINAMSSFSNADTGSKTADPYTEKNLQEPSLKEKVEDLLAFVDKTKFCLLTTQTVDSDLLASRAMALAAKVRHL